MNKMNRRDAFRSLAALGMGALAALGQRNNVRPRAFANGPRWGHVTAETHVVNVYLNGADVSGQSFEADDILGFVGMFETDAQGQISSPFKKFRVYGRVKIERRGRGVG